MNVETQIRAWKDSRFRSTLSSKELLPNPAGVRLIELDGDELRAVWGARVPDAPITLPSTEGYICTVSGECNDNGQSCW